MTKKDNISEVKKAFYKVLNKSPLERNMFGQYEVIVQQKFSANGKVLKI